MIKALTKSIVITMADAPNPIVGDRDTPPVGGGGDFNSGDFNSTDFNT